MRMHKMATTAFVSFLLMGSVYAQTGDDVCCILGKTEGDGATVRAEVASPSDCKAGTSTSVYKICAALPDPQNLCPTYEDKDLCGKCGYHWTGQACMKEDPVAKAKKQLAEEAAKKTAQEAGTEKK